MAIEQFKGPCLALGIVAQEKKNYCCKLVVLTEMKAPLLLSLFTLNGTTTGASRNGHNLSECAAKCCPEDKYLSYPTGPTELQMEKKMNLVSGNKGINATASLFLHLCTTSPCNFCDSFQHIPLKHENGGQ